MLYSILYLNNSATVIQLGSNGISLIASNGGARVKYWVNDVYQGQIHVPNTSPALLLVPPGPAPKQGEWFRFEFINPDIVGGSVTIKY